MSLIGRAGARMDAGVDARRAGLSSLAILDSGPEPAVDAVLRMAQTVFQTASALIALIDVERYGFKARIDVANEPCLAFCRHAFLKPERSHVVPDARLDPRFWNDPLVKADPFIRFYAGAPLSVNGVAVGALCLVDPSPRHDFGDERRRELAAVAATVEALLQLRQETVERRALAEADSLRSRQLQLAAEIADMGYWVLDPATGASEWSDQTYAIFGVERASFNPNTLDLPLNLYEPESRARVAAHAERALATGEAFNIKAVIRRRSDDALRTVRAQGEMLPSHDGSRSVLFGVVRDITEEEALVRQVEEDRERYRLLTQNATDVIAAYGPDGTFTYLSPSIRTLAGHEADALVGRTTYEIIHPDDHDRVQGAFEDLVRSDEPSARIEYRAVKADGSTVWVEAHPSPVYSQGQLTGFQDVVRDVSARKAAEEAAAISETRYRLLAENANDMVATMAPDSTVLFVTPAVTRLLGYAPEELVGRKTLALTHPQDVPATVTLFKDLIAAGPGAGSSARAYQFRALHKDGSWVWLEGQPRVEFDATGAPARFQDVVRDITARKDAETAVQAAAARAEAARVAATESERRYRLLAENATDMICRYDVDGTIRYVSPGCVEVLGFHPADLIGRTTADLIHPDDGARVRAEFAAYVASSDPTPIRTEYRVVRKDGEVIWLEGRPRLVRDGDGPAREYVDVMRDVTLRKRLEDELLAARIAAEVASQAKSDFLANISHELRTPLTGMLGYADLLASSDALGPPERRQAALIGRAGRSLLDIVNDVLDLSSIEASGVKLRNEEVDVAALLHEAAEMVGPQAKAKSLALRTELAPCLARVRLDPDRLRQVVLNLLGNAVKFTECGEVRLTLTETSVSPAGLALRIDVHDSGIGIASDRLDRVFGRFEQADGSITRRYGGTGLGLSISQALVTAMGGRLQVDSEVGRGSTFSIFLEAPLAAPSVEAPAVIETAIAAPSNLAGLRVLLAEDVAVNRELIALFLSPHAIALTSVANGAEAVGAAQAVPYDVVLMDVQMPVMGGLEATRRIRALRGPASRTPIIALTANILPAEVARCRDAGMNGHIGKPFSAESLTTAITTAVARPTTG